MLFLGGGQLTISALDNRDLNNVTDNGFYVVWDTCSNLPSGSYGGYMIVMKPHLLDPSVEQFVLQMFFSVGQLEWKYRYRWATTAFGSWNRMM